MAIDWQYLMRTYDWAGHIVEALVMAAVVAGLARLAFRSRTSILIGLAFAIGHSHGREKRDYEVSVHMPPPQLDAYLIWKWSWDQATDFWPVAVVLLGTAIYLAKRPHRSSGPQPRQDP